MRAARPSVFSPHTRGCSANFWRAVKVVPVFPAYAGMFPDECCNQRHGCGFPCMRGDVPSLRLLASSPKPFSPRARGCSACCMLTAGMSTIFPAYAGMFRLSRWNRMRSPSFLHKHEDLPSLRTWNFSTGEYSPRKRGHSGNPP